MKRLRYAVIGTGGVGGYYGGRLAHAGHDVHFLFHSDYEHVRQHGLRVESCNGDFELPDIQAYSNTEQMGPADVVLVGLKTTNETLLAKLLPPLMKEDTIIILIQNGVGVEEAVSSMLPNAKLAAGLAFIGSAKNRPGVVEHYFYGHINLASYNLDSSGSERLEQVAEEMRTSGIATRVLDYAEARWKKAVWNMPFNGLSVAMRMNTADLISGDMEPLVREMMAEVIAGAQACGAQGIDESFIDAMIESTRRMPSYAPSMKLDYEHGREMEIEFLYRRPLAMARAAGAPMVRLEMLERMLSKIAQKMREE